MIYKNTYYFYKNVIPKWLCNNLINETLKNNKLTLGKVGNNLKSNLKLEERNSDIFFLEKEIWLNHLLHSLLTKANFEAGWKFDIEQIEVIQFTKYKLNQFYDWHTDCSENLTQNINGRQLHRKISMVVSLNDSSEYKGGEFQIQTVKTPTHIIDVLKEAGSVIVFPSYIHHRVTPVLKGERYSLVAWFLGPAFK